MPVAVSVAFTCAFGTELPDGSVTVPLMAPRNVCAFTATPKLKITITASNNRLILPPPLFDFQSSSPAPGLNRPHNTLLLQAVLCRPHAPALKVTSPQKHKRHSAPGSTVPLLSTIEEEKPARAKMA